MFYGHARAPFIDRMGLIKSRRLKGQLGRQVYTLCDSGASGGMRRHGSVSLKQEGEESVRGPFPLKG